MIQSTRWFPPRKIRTPSAIEQYRPNLECRRFSPMKNGWRAVGPIANLVAPSGYLTGEKVFGVEAMLAHYSGLQVQSADAGFPADLLDSRYRNAPPSSRWPATDRSSSADHARRRNRSATKASVSVPGHDHRRQGDQHRQAAGEAKLAVDEDRQRRVGAGQEERQGELVERRGEGDQPGGDDRRGDDGQDDRGAASSGSRRRGRPPPPPETG